MIHRCDRKVIVWTNKSKDGGFNSKLTRLKILFGACAVSMVMVIALLVKDGALAWILASRQVLSSDY